MEITTREEYEIYLTVVNEGLANPPEPGTPEASALVEIVKAVSQAVSQFDEVPTEDEAAVVYEISGIKCDACDYRDDVVNVADYADYVGTPCPECSANLLTEEDFRTVQLMISLSDVVNTLTARGALPADDGERVEMEFGFDGSGKATIK